MGIESIIIASTIRHVLILSYRLLKHLNKYCHACSTGAVTTTAANDKRQNKANDKQDRQEKQEKQDKQESKTTPTKNTQDCKNIINKNTQNKNTDIKTPEKDVVKENEIEEVKEKFSVNGKI